MRMLTSRTRTRPPNSRIANPRSCVPAPASRAVVSLTFPPLASLEGLCLRRRLQDLLRFGVSLEARRGLEVAAHSVGRDEDESRVGLGRARDPSGDLVKVELYDGEEALQIGLLVDGEVYMAFAQVLQDLWRQVVAAGLDAFVVQPELRHHLCRALGAARVDGEHPGHILVAVVPGLDPGPLLRYISARGDLLDLYVLPRILYGLLRAIYSRLDVELTRRRYKERHEPLVDEADDPLAHLDAGLEEVLAHVCKRGVRPWPLAVGVVGDNRDTVVQGLLDRLVESDRVYDRDGDAVGVAGDGGVHRVDHLRDNRLFRARPLRRRPKERLCILDTILGRYEERVCGHVVDEDEVPFRRVREVAARPASTTLARLLRSLAPAPCEQQSRGSQRTPRKKLPAAQPVLPEPGSTLTHLSPLSFAFQQPYPCRHCHTNMYPCQAHPPGATRCLPPDPTRVPSWRWYRHPRRGPVL